MTLPTFHMIAGAPDPVAPFSHAVEVDGWVFVTGQMPFTGKSATSPIAEIFRIADGQIVEVWVYSDTLSIMQQFGIIPTSGGA